MNGLYGATLGVKVSYRHFKHFFPVLQLLTHIYTKVAITDNGHWLERSAVLAIFSTCDYFAVQSSMCATL